jgi:hypothetical protein
MYTRKNIAKELGIGIETLRYYEKLGLIQEPSRSSKGYRIYYDNDIAKINHILMIKKYGFPLREIVKVDFPSISRHFPATIVAKGGSRGSRSLFRRVQTGSG